MALRTFLYGREDAARNKRGYGVFAKSASLTSSHAFTIEKIMGISDPSPFLIRRIATLYLYFPLPESEPNLWLFAKGRVEDRGGHNSYLFHGVLLDEEQRRQLHYVPFLLDDQLDMDPGEDRTLKTSVEIPAQKILPPGGLKPLLSSFQPENHNRLLHCCGEFITKIANRPKELRYLYNNELNTAFWSMLYWLTPPDLREDLSMASLPGVALSTYQDLFLLKGEVEGDPASKQREQPAITEGLIACNKPEKTRFGDFFASLNNPQAEERAKAKIDLIHGLYSKGDSFDAAGDSLPSIDHVNSILEKVSRPSIASLSGWPKGLENRIPLKVHHFMDVWEGNKLDLALNSGNQTEPDSVYPVLAASMLIALAELIEEVDEEINEAEGLGEQKQRLSAVNKKKGDTLKEQKKHLSAIMKDIKKTVLPPSKEKEVLRRDGLKLLIKRNDWSRVAPLLLNSADANSDPIYSDLAAIMMGEHCDDDVLEKIVPVVLTRGKEGQDRLRRMMGSEDFFKKHPGFYEKLFELFEKRAISDVTQSNQKDRALARILSEGIIQYIRGRKERSREQKEGIDDILKYCSGHPKLLENVLYFLMKELCFMKGLDVKSAVDDMGKLMSNAGKDPVGNTAYKNAYKKLALNPDRGAHHFYRFIKDNECLKENHRKLIAEFKNEEGEGSSKKFEFLDRVNDFVISST